LLNYHADRSHQDNRDRSCDIGALSHTIAASTNWTARFAYGARFAYRGP